MMWIGIVAVLLAIAAAAFWWRYGRNMAAAKIPSGAPRKPAGAQNDTAPDAGQNAAIDAAFANNGM